MIPRVIPKSNQECIKSFGENVELTLTCFIARVLLIDNIDAALAAYNAAIAVSFLERLE